MSYVIEKVHWNGIPILTLRGDGPIEAASDQLHEQFSSCLQEGKNKMVLHFAQPMEFSTDDFSKMMMAVGAAEFSGARGKINVVVSWQDRRTLEAFSAVWGIFGNIKDALEDLVAPAWAAGEIYQMVV